MKPHKARDTSDQFASVTTQTKVRHNSAGRGYNVCVLSRGKNELEHKLPAVVEIIKARLSWMMMMMMMIICGGNIFDRQHRSKAEKRTPSSLAAISDETSFAGGGRGSTCRDVSTRTFYIGANVMASTAALSSTKPLTYLAQSIDTVNHHTNNKKTMHVDRFQLPSQHLRRTVWLGTCWLMMTQVNSP